MKKRVKIGIAFLVVVLLILAFLLFNYSFKITGNPIVSRTTGFNFVVWSDTQQGIEMIKPISSQASSLNPEIVLQSGDVEPGGFTEDGMEIWKNENVLFDITFPVRGNHDNANAVGWQNYFNFASKVSDIGGSNYNFMPNYEDLTYSFDYGNSHFIGLDVPGDIVKKFFNRAAILDWLDKDLTEAEARGLTHAFIYFHPPLYCVDGHCKCTTKICTSDNTQDDIIKIINKHPIVSATFNGHEHVLAHIHMSSERMSSIAKDREFEAFINSPAGGAPYKCIKPERYEYCTSSFGFLGVQVIGNKLNFSFYKLGSEEPAYQYAVVKEGANCENLELCDGLDNDCDSLIDEDLSRECGVGTCLGTQTCLNGSWLACNSLGKDAGTCASCNQLGETIFNSSQIGDCNDNIACTQDSCSGINSCNHLQNNNSCNDNLFCNGQEYCNLGLGCVSSSSITCQEDSFECSVAFCDEATDSCSFNVSSCSCIQDSNCHSSNICLTPRCINYSCSLVQNNDICNDYNNCTLSDRCNQGVCRGVNRTVEDGNSRTFDLCLENGTIVHLAISSNVSVNLSSIVANTSSPSINITTNNSSNSANDSQQTMSENDEDYVNSEYINEEIEEISKSDIRKTSSSTRSSSSINLDTPSIVIIIIICLVISGIIIILILSKMGKI